MKKRLLLFPIFLILLAIVSAPTINYHSNDHMENKFYYHQDSNVETTRVFLILEDKRCRQSRDLFPTALLHLLNSDRYR